MKFRSQISDFRSQITDFRIEISDFQLRSNSMSALETQLVTNAPPQIDLEQLIARHPHESFRHAELNKPARTETAISVQDLRKSYGDFEAVRGINLEISAGEIFGLIGPDGAGKTSCF